ncbi:UDP-N-acetyl glucosamine 2-epimerase [Sphingomonas sp. Root710]|uniref:non-hydrolyzing UDP-N-acetylglucosamine 2-epimerase n=1 Tax=Sphingomonas sp. Root710 TaxID=1736594 RepID=UPI0006FB8991|nr:UDP-N-acetylglucosamine 2-epimerase (non-hydrolyzing) [Sphingomonas sp. Root710]KRB85409.1 UDP-N-acetyl glucosamine 2-epimerase [Sphingomonas sp. Root710]
MPKVALVHLIAAARPNFMKVAPLWHALKATSDFRPVIVHTGQHYDAAMSDDIFADLGLPAPDHHLGIGSGSHAEQTGKVMIAYEKLAMEERPDWLIVVGDVNSTAAASMAAGKLRIPIVHLEAGLRSRDRDMPEELNRLVTDVLADVLWTPSADADANLIAEGIPPERITRVGNIMMDSYELVRPAIEAADYPGELGYAPGGYGVVTLHRPSNVDVPEQLDRLVAALIAAQAHLPLIFPVHPRTKQRLGDAGMARLETAGVKLVGPAAYVRFMSLVAGAAAVITDSGGIQEETTYLGIPCLTLRENTERPITISEGTAQLVNADKLLERLIAALAQPKQDRKRPGYWDGKTAGRCVEDLRRRTTERP